MQQADLAAALRDALAYAEAISPPEVFMHGPEILRVEPGERVRIALPFSEACMHMHVAGRVMWAALTPGESPGVQLLTDEGRPFSFPITTGEAGVYRDACGYYSYRPRAVAP